MAITTDDVILKFGTQDEITTGTPGTISDNSFSVAGDVDSTWANDDDAPFGAAVLKCQFDTTMPTEGFIGLYARLLNIQGTNDENAVDSNFLGHPVGAFEIDFGVANDVDFYTAIPLFRMPMVKSGQEIEWYIKNEETGQTIGSSWQLWITPISAGPHG